MPPQGLPLGRLDFHAARTSESWRPTATVYTRGNQWRNRGQEPSAAPPTPGLATGGSPSRHPLALEIAPQDGVVFVRDLKSTKGTLVDAAWMADWPMVDPPQADDGDLNEFFKSLS